MSEDFSERDSAEQPKVAEESAEAISEVTEELVAETAETQDSTEEEIEVELSELDKALLRIADLEDQVSRRKADLYNLQQEYSAYVKRTKQESLKQHANGVKKVLEALLGVLDNAHLARDHGELSGPAGKVIEELENTLKTNFALARFGEVGEEFDPLKHEALMHQTSTEVETQQVAQLIQPGYTYAETVLRPARVGVVSPE